MQIPPQEDWSLELLNELQRAVPVLESSSFNLDDDDEDGVELELSLSGAAGAVADLTFDSRGDVIGSGAGSDGWVLPRQTDRAPAREDTQEPAPGGLTNISAELFSDDAMALPMSTLTSGKRRTYPNRSTFQAHVCCVMDPSQVPHVLNSLQVSPHFQSVRHWPYAYHIISPFDGQAHEGFCDGDDPGAGEKMLALLTRMGLENLLLIVSRWDTGPPGRLGSELFRCVNQQCKELLRELQQAVRASFPPEELLRPDFAQHPENNGPSDADPDGGTADVDASNDAYEDEVSGWQQDTASADCFLPSACPLLPGMVHDDCDGNGADAQGFRQWDMRPLGATQYIPPRFYWVTEGIVHQAQRVRYLAHATAVRKAKSLMESTNLPADTAYSAKANFEDAQRAVIEKSGLKVQKCALNMKVNGPRTLPLQNGDGDVAGQTISPESSIGAEETGHALCLPEAEGQEVRSVTKMRRSLVKMTRNAEDDGGKRRDLLNHLTNEELLRFGSQLRTDRHTLEDSLDLLSKASEIIKTSPTNADGTDSNTDATASPPKLGRRNSGSGRRSAEIDRRGAGGGKDKARPHALVMV